MRGSCRAPHRPAALHARGRLALRVPPPDPEHIMTPELTPETWTQIRYEYEQTEKPVDDICLDHGVSPSTLRERMRRWRWTRRRQPIPAEGPPPSPAIEHAAPVVSVTAPIRAPAPSVWVEAQDESAPDSPAPHAAPRDETPPDQTEIVPRLQGAVARVLPAIEATVARLAAGPMPPREMERAARTLTSLTRTLRELNTLLAEQPAGRCRECADIPEDIDAFRIDLARRITAICQAEERRENGDGAEPEA
jgi:transposase-like protein